MISSELIHNPYLLLTKVKFNGQEPKINSQIEKYEHLPLKDWVSLVPNIFYNEMNGYDFDLYFTGTKPDFEEVKKSFRNDGVSTEQVRLFHKNELEDADTKSKEIYELIEWLESTPNRKFDYNAFKQNNAELFEGSYSYITIRGNAPKGMPQYIGVETVENAQELSNTVLTSIPIVFYIEEGTTQQFRQDLLELLSRNDVRQDQLFFMIYPMMNVSQVVRVISDLGVKNPQVIKRYDEEAVMMYLRNYPVSEYIREAIEVFSKEVGDMTAALEKANTESQITNAGIHNEINILESELVSLKEVDDFFVHRDNYNTSLIFREAHFIVEDQIRKWKNRKTKVTGDNEIEAASEDYESNLTKYMAHFVENVTSAYQNAQEEIRERFTTAYMKANIDTGFKPSELLLPKCQGVILPDMKNELLKMKEVSYVENKNNFFGLFKKTTDDNVEMVRVVTCYYEKWRLKALEIVMPLADDVIKSCSEALVHFYDDLAMAYHNHLLELISGKMEEKEQVTARLSDDERKLQEDNDWLAEFRDRLQTIERG